MNEEIGRLMSDIESFDFKFDLNQASGFVEFKRRMRNHTAFMLIRELISDDEYSSKTIFLRILELSSLDSDYRYEHTYDSALATYLLLLDIQGAKYSIPAARVIINLPRIWWAEKTATQIIASAKHKVRSEDGKSISEQNDPEIIYPLTTSTSVKEFLTLNNLNPIRSQSLVWIEDLERIVSEFQPRAQTPWVVPLSGYQRQLWKEKYVFVTGNTIESRDWTEENLSQDLIEVSS